MNIINKDTNMLKVFVIVMEELNASRAAERLALSQPALSHALKKLRRDFNDPLFVRRSKGLAPTPKALTLMAGIRQIVNQMEQVYQQGIEEDDYLSQQRDIRLYTTDHMQAIMLPLLLPLLHKEAPGIRLIAQDPRGYLPRKELESGGCDIAIAGYFSHLPDTYYQQKIGEDSFVTLACRSNPFINKKLTLNRFLSCSHILTTLTGDLNGLVDKALNEKGYERKIIAGVPSFLAVSDMLIQQPFLLTCLSSLAERAISIHPEIASYPCPVTLPKIELYQIWHERTHNDKLMKWFRIKIHEIMLQLPHLKKH